MTGQADAQGSNPMVPTTQGSAVATPTTGNAVMDQIMSQLQSQNGIQSSSDGEFNDLYSKAIEQLKGSSTDISSAISSQYNLKEQNQTRINQQNITSAEDAQRGFATNSALLSQINDQGKQAINDLEEQKNQLIMTGASEAASKIADLQVKQAQDMQTQRQQVFQNLVSLAGVASETQKNQISQAQLVLQQQQQEADLESKKGAIALQYGVKVGANDSVSDVVNRAAGNAKALYDLGVQDAAASVNLKNAQAEYQKAQSATQANKSVADFTGYFQSIDSMGGIKSTFGTAAQQNMMNAIATNPTSLMNFAKASAKYQQPHVVADPGLAQSALTARSSGQSLGDYILNSITDNPSVSNKDRAEEIARTIYGQPNVPGLLPIWGQMFLENTHPQVTPYSFPPVGISGLNSAF